MPPVFDTAAHIQRIPTYREGKALKLANTNRDLINQQLEQEIEYYPEQQERQERQVDIQEENLGLRQEELQARIAEYKSQASEEDFAIAVGGAVAGLDAEERGEDPTAAMQAYYSARDPDQDLSEIEYERQAALALTSALQNGGDRTAQKFIDKNGKPVQGSIDKQGRYFDSSGNQRTDITPIAPQATQSDLGIFNTSGDKVTERLTKEVVGGTENLLSSIDRIEKQITSIDQSSLGLPGTATKLIDNVASAVIGFADIFPNSEAQIGEQTVKESALLNAKLYQDMFSGPAAQSAALQANSIGLAYTLARAANPDGRISDADVKHQLKRVILNSSSKTQILSAVTEVKREVMVNMANYMRVNDLSRSEKGKAYYDSLMKKIETIDQAQDSEADTPRISNNADFDALPSGTIFIDPEGNRRQKP